jgi:tetratricopeptide (TPR) repeat protein
MPRLLVPILALMIFSCCAGPTNEFRSDATRSLATAIKPPEVKLYAFKDYDIMTVYQKTRKDDGMRYAQWIKKVAAWQQERKETRNFSEKHHYEIVLSKEWYASGRYGEAVDILLPVVKEEPYNLFALESLARALYRHDDRGRSFEFYHRLIGMLDNQQNYAGEKNIVPIDMSFPEAYWKYGTLLMDKEYWGLGAFNISRFLMILSKMQEPQPLILFDQALSSLTKAYFHMKKFEIAKYYAQEALKLNPDNQYVRKYIKKMK